MANIKSQIKRNRQNERRYQRNKSVRSEIHTRTKSALGAIGAGESGADELVRQAIKRIDAAAAKGIIHSNQASRRKSRLMRKLSNA
ncbi:MAG: 30S ribosomal protein S20 [Actinobacteria bacterium]|nr:30S ribosomal protein S20 [Actinomycetota bacterium]